MTAAVRWVLITSLVVVVAVVPFVFFRCVYAHGKRLREVVPGRVYRCGQLTEEGFIDAHQRLNFRTVINFQDDYPDPDLEHSFWDRRTVKESDLWARLGVRYVFIGPDLVSPRDVPDQRPEAIDRLLAVLDDESTYPVLFHCKAGLHRTGLATAIYRMEYQGWTRLEAFQEMRDLGFGFSTCTASNQYVNQYVLTYRPGLRHPVRSTAVAHKGE